MKETFELELIKCGKPACKSCPHGPYWYGYRTVRGRVVKRYIGKKLPEHLREKVLFSGSRIVTKVRRVREEIADDYDRLAPSDGGE